MPCNRYISIVVIKGILMEAVQSIVSLFEKLFGTEEETRYKLDFGRLCRQSRLPLRYEVERILRPLNNHPRYEDIRHVFEECLFNAAGIKPTQEPKGTAYVTLVTGKVGHIIQVEGDRSVSIELLDEKARKSTEVFSGYDDRLARECEDSTAMRRNLCNICQKGTTERYRTPTNQEIPENFGLGLFISNEAEKKGYVNICFDIGERGTRTNIHVPLPDVIDVEYRMVA